MIARLGSPAVVFVTAVALRLALGIVNHDANDVHIDVVDMIAYHGHFGEHGECDECYQPKFFYLVAALLVRLLHARSTMAELRVCQLLNVAVGAATLVISWRTLRQLAVDERWRRLTFALLAFNPGLLGINGQVTNDTFGICLGTIAFVLLLRWIYQRRGWPWLCVTVVLSALTKGNGIVVYLLCLLIGTAVVVLGGRAKLHPGDRRRLLVGMAGLSLVFLSVVPFVGPYAHHYRKLGSAFATNSTRVEPPHFIDETAVKRPGVKSVVSAYLTFRIVDLLEKGSVVSNEPEPYPALRTSLWTVAYAMGTSSFFQRWPPTWVPDGDGILWLERLIFLLALVPLGWLLVGFGAVVVEVIRWRAFRTLPTRVLWAMPWLAAFLAMLIKYTYDYRDYATMKAVFLFPAILPLTLLMAWGMACVAQRVAGWRGGTALLALLQGAAVALIVCDLAETVVLINLLAGR